MDPGPQTADPGPVVGWLHCDACLSFHAVPQLSQLSAYLASDGVASAQSAEGRGCVHPILPPALDLNGSSSLMALVAASDRLQWPRVATIDGHNKEGGWDRR